MRFDSRLLQREIALAAAALLAAVLALGVADWHESEPAGARVPASSVPAPGGGWYEAIAAPIRASSKPTECGYSVDADTVGVAHPVLPCEIKLFVRYGRNEVLTQVIGRPPPGPGRQFGLTRGLARALGTRGTVRIRWRYAAPPR